MAKIKEGSTILKQKREEKIITIPDISREAKKKLNKENFKMTLGTFRPFLFGQRVKGDNRYKRREGSYIAIGNVVFFTLDIIVDKVDSNMNKIINVGGLPFKTASISTVNISRIGGLKYTTSTMTTGLISHTGEYRDAIYLYKS